MNGFGDGIRTLGAQAWGAGNYTQTGMWLQAGLFWIVLGSVPIVRGLAAARMACVRACGASGSA